MDALSFSNELHRLRRELNARIDSPDSSAGPAKPHTLVVARWYGNRRVSIAEAYVRVVNDLDSHHAKSRLRALRAIMDLSFRTKTLDMPLNTARVQLALVKEAVKHRGDRRRQLELLRDFSESSHGQYHIIRKLLDEFNLVELPETGKPLAELDAGWDLNVHDNATSGRKNATQLLIDAFMKGMSEITIAHGSASTTSQMREAVEAGRIVGIRVDLGIEFSLNRCQRRYHFMALLPPMHRGADVLRFFQKNRKRLKELLAGIEENQENRVGSVRRLLRNFNETILPSLNEGFPNRGLYRVPKLRMRDLAVYGPLESVDRMRLGDFLHANIKPVYFNRVLLLKVKRERAVRERAVGLISEADRREAEARLERWRTEYRDLSPEGLRLRWFSDASLSDYASVLDNLESIRGRLRDADCTIRILRPLEHGLAKAIELLESSYALIDQFEVYNTQDCARRDPAEISTLCRKLNEVNAGLLGANLAPVLPVCGSDSKGRNPEIPGMGFVFADRIGGKGAPRFARKHRALPKDVALLVASRGGGVDFGAAGPALLSLGKTSEPFRNRVGDEPEEASARISPARALRYINPAIANAARTLVGFFVARYFIGDAYALLWLGITGFRNSAADLLATRGIRFREWTFRSVNVTNVARSLFWTGFSVPILSFVKANFDHLWPLAATGLLYEATKFFFISGANGLYIATHNRLRGFDRGVIRANLFRSVLSWPFATLFAPIGNLLGIPSIVQAKLWSDTIAGFIEGGGKFLKVTRLRRRDLEEIIPRLEKGTTRERYAALLDLLYLWREEPRTRNSLAVVLSESKPSPGNSEVSAGKEEADSLSILLRAVSVQSLESKLLDFALEEYSHESAVDLAGLIASSLPDLKTWLFARKPAMKKLPVAALLMAGKQA